jgi:hypothetical protein
MTNEDLKNRFTYHAPKTDAAMYFSDIRNTAHKFACVINNVCPEGREKSLAVTKIEEAVMWANAAIVREVKDNG